MSKPFQIVISTILIAIIVAIAISTILSYRTDKRPALCCNNLRLIEYAKGVTRVENKLKDGDAVEPSVVGGLLLDGFPVCPDGGTYTINPIGQDPTCSIGGEHILK